MAIGDDRKTIQIADLDLQKVNTALAQLSTWVMRLEGRSGGINLRDSVTIQSDKQSLIDFESGTAGKASIAVFGTENATLAFAKGSRKENNGDWVATDTVSVIWALDRAGNGTLYVNTGLVEGQAFTPTVSFVVGSGGSVTPHVLDSATHTVSGKTAGHVLQALSATTYGFAALSGLNVTNTPAGGIAATTVQAAINELDTEKVAKAGDTMTGNLTLTSGSSYSPQEDMINTNADSTGGYRIFSKTSASPAAGDELGTVLWRANNASAAQVNYVAMAAQATDVTAGAHKAKLIVSLSNSERMVLTDDDLWLTGKRVFTHNDTYLRVNQYVDFTNGIWLSGSPLRQNDGGIYLGSAGAAGQIQLIGTTADQTTRITADGGTGRLTAIPSFMHRRSNSAYGAFSHGSMLGYAVTWTSDSGSANSVYSLVTIGGLTNGGIQFSEAGYYQVNVQLCQTVGAGVTGLVYSGRFNSAGTFQTYLPPLYAELNGGAANTTQTSVASFVEYFAANDIYVVSFNVNALNDSNWNFITITKQN